MNGAATKGGAHPRLAIIGAGPIGLEAALYGLDLGYDIKVYERGPIGASIGAWGHVRMFTPWSMNTTSLGLRLLDEHGLDPPEPDSYPTGTDLLQRYLQPLGSSNRVAARMITDTSVVSISRESQLKFSNLGAPQDRATTPFRLLVHDGAQARIEHADIVLDCSGTYGNPAGFGAGGMDPVDTPLHIAHIDRGLNDVLGLARERYAGRHTLLVGRGYSAATQTVALEQLATETPGTRTTWVTAADGARPIAPIADDPLQERRELTEMANGLADDTMSSITHIGSGHVSNLATNAHGKLNVNLMHGDGSLSTVVDVDVVMALVGYRPDIDLDRELQIHRCYATEGTMKLAAKMLATGSSDCLDLGGQGPESLRNPEPDFYCLGTKSYGRNSSFLLQHGHEQIRDVFQLISGDESLDLYRES